MNLGTARVVDSHVRTDAMPRSHDAAGRQPHGHGHALEHRRLVWHAAPCIHHCAHVCVCRVVVNSDILLTQSLPDSIAKLRVHFKDWFLAGARLVDCVFCLMSCPPLSLPLSSLPLSFFDLMCILLPRHHLTPISSPGTTSMIFLQSTSRAGRTSARPALSTMCAQKESSTLQAAWYDTHQHDTQYDVT